ncbi:acyl-CoA dehydrogenase family protein [Saccharomonospora piscinae]|uniref:Acyl-CoA dehydrogenase n=1 Tax=Saccharomonospora piscinae TaxID=687388 RepID=A0A1V9A608_SACPI|nr:acyl-CoA dehydrogenase family protein [Saccharomonospora piscinae]OQO92585.1 acyl-CoA dehydrogenase [Saccharomonospora piscinae]TLW91704.1 acyl-CoA dehydrogenase [Saccharomonospora piscinae]
MTKIGFPSRRQLTSKASDIVPILQKHAPWAEENRRLHDEVVEAMADAGVFRLRKPKRYDGYEVNSETLVDVLSELGRGDASAAWVATVYTIPGWMACMFPDEVQDEVFADPDTRICGTLSPSATATPVKGGVVVNGRWQFISGAHHSQWQQIIAILVPPDGEPHPVMALVPMSELQIVDDWHTSGLRGTGSVSTVANKVFVPEERVLPLMAAVDGEPVSRHTAESRVYRTPLLPVAASSSSGCIVGLGKAAKQAFAERLPGRKITYTDYDSQRDAPLTHLQVAESTMKLDEAEFHVRRLATTVDTKGAEGSDWTIEERVLARADLGQAVRLVRESVDILATASGGTSIYSDVPIQRIARDIHAVHQHALMHPNTNAELYGRVLCGLPPNSQYV